MEPEYRIKNYSVVKQEPTAFGASATVYANEEYVHPNGYVQSERKKVAVFEVASDADRYAKEKNETLGNEYQLWMEERALIKLRALKARVGADIEDIQASEGNVPAHQLKKQIAAAHHYMKVSGGQQFEE